MSNFFQSFHISFESLKDKLFEDVIAESVFVISIKQTKEMYLVYFDHTLDSTAAAALLARDYWSQTSRCVATYFYKGFFNVVLFSFDQLLWKTEFSV